MIARGSAISDWKQCRRLYGLRWIDGWQSKLTNPHLLIGTLVHAGLAAIHNDQDPTRLIHTTIEKGVDPKLLSAAQLDLVENCYKLALTMCDSYRKHWKSDAGAGRTIGTEVEFRIAVGKHTLTGTVDRIAQQPNGDIEVWEHKTTSDTRAEYDQVAAIRWQTYGYYLAARKITGSWPKAVIYNILGKPSIRQGKKESRDDYYARVAAEYSADGAAFFRRATIRIGISAIQEYVKQVGAILDEMESTPRSLYYSNDAYCIRGRSAACEFLDMCSAYRTEPDERLFNKQHDKVQV